MRVEALETRVLKAIEEVKKEVGPENVEKTLGYAGQQPPMFPISSAFLWTAGYAPRLDTYLGPETPNPIEIRVQRGKCELETVLTDVMGLTKINFNSCLHNDRMPVTIRFADAVGEVILAAPQTGERQIRRSVQRFTNAKVGKRRAALATALPGAHARSGRLAG